MRELLRSNAFREYRKKQVEAVCSHIDIFNLRCADDAMRLKGALEMARILIRLPETLMEEKHQPKVQAQIFEDVKAVEAGILRKHLTGGKK